MFSDNHAHVPLSNFQDLTPRRPAAARMRMEQRRAERLALEDRARLQVPFMRAGVLVKRCATVVLGLLTTAATTARRATPSVD